MKLTSDNINGFALAVTLLYVAMVLPLMFDGKVIMTTSSIFLGIGTIGVGTEFSNMENQDEFSDFFIGLGFLLPSILMVFLWTIILVKVLLIFLSAVGVYGLSLGVIGLINRRRSIKGVNESVVSNDKFIDKIGGRIFGILATLIAFGANLATILAYVSKLVN
jgi:hypothetical protein